MLGAEIGAAAWKEAWGMKKIGHRRDRQRNYKRNTQEEEAKSKSKKSIGIDGTRIKSTVLCRVASTYFIVGSGYRSSRKVMLEKKTD